MLDPWPLVGRGGQLDHVREAVADRRCSGAFVTGPLGVGRSRLLQEALLQCTASGSAVELVSGMAASAAVPFGPLLHLLPPDEPRVGNPPELTRRLLAELARQRSNHGLAVVAFDDAHLLDDASATVAYELATHWRVPVLAAAPSRQRLPRPLAALLEEGRVRTIALAPLAPDEVDELLGRVLGGLLEDDTRNQLWEISRGIVRVLHDVVTRAVEVRSLALEGGRWRWPGTASIGPLLDEVIDGVYRLSGGERRVVELIALGEPLEALVLERLTDASAVVAVERNGLVEVVRDGRRVTARLSSALSPELMRAGTPPLAIRAARRSLADALAVTGRRRRHDLPRLVSLRLEAGEAPAIAELLQAAEQVIEVFDPVRGERLARAAVEAGAGLRAKQLLALALFDLRRGEEAEALLAEIEPEAQSEEDKITIAVTRAQNLFFRLKQPDLAYEVLASAEAGAASEVSHLRLGALRGELLLWSDSITHVIEDVERPGPADGARPAPWRLSLSTLARAYSGQPEMALANLDTAEDPWANAVSRQWSRWWALWLSGRLREALGAAESFYAAARDDEASRRFPASWPMMLGYALLLRGRPRSACRYLREAISLGTDRAGFRHLCLTLLAQACALTGEIEEANLALQRARELHIPSLRSHQYEISLAEAWVAAAEGKVATGVDRALTAAHAARTLRQQPFEAVALHTVVRLGRPREVVGRLEELAARVDGRLAKVLAGHARPSADEDGLALVAVARRLHETGADICAAEAAAQASLCLHRRGQEADAYSCHLYAVALADGCEGSCTPGLELLHAELDPLTAREREVAALAGTRLTSGEIAHQLSISTRTADNHLYRVYRKLGVSSRAELSALRSQSASWLEVELTPVA